MTAHAENTPPAELKQKKYVVAFLDFLGASDKMMSPEESDEFLRQITEIYQKSIDAFKEYNEIENRATTNIKYRIFSDNIIIVEECAEDIPKNEMISIAGFSAMFQVLSMIDGAPVRGGITCGNFYMDPIIVYGEALVKSHLMECKEAIYPRIIVDHDILGGREATLETLNSKTEMLVQDTDGRLFINFFNPITCHISSHRVKSIEYINAIRELIIDEFSKMDASTDFRIRHKYRWLAKTFNRLCKEEQVGDLMLALDANGEPTDF